MYETQLQNFVDVFIHCSMFRGQEREQPAAWRCGAWEQVDGTVEFPMGRQNLGLFFTEDILKVPVVSGDP